MQGRGSRALSDRATLRHTAMMDSLVINQQLVERCLASLRLFDKMCSDEEWKMIANVIEFLKIFKTATQVLSGSKYPTIRLVLLFRVKIVAVPSMICRLTVPW